MHADLRVLQHRHSLLHRYGYPFKSTPRLAIAAEFLGSLGLITGFLSRIAAFGIAVNMIVAVKMVHGANGFFMNWFGNQKGEGFEYHILAIGLALIVMIYGAGKGTRLCAVIVQPSPKGTPEA